MLGSGDPDPPPGYCKISRPSPTRNCCPLPCSSRVMALPFDCHLNDPLSVSAATFRSRYWVIRSNVPALLSFNLVLIPGQSAHGKTPYNSPPSRANSGSYAYPQPVLALALMTRPFRSTACTRIGPWLKQTVLARLSWESPRQKWPDDNVGVLSPGDRPERLPLYPCCETAISGFAFL